MATNLRYLRLALEAKNSSSAVTDGMNSAMVANQSKIVMATEDFM